ELPASSLQVGDFVEEASGTIVGSARVGGTMDMPTAEFAAAAEDGIMVGETRIDTAELTGCFSENVLYLDQLRATQAAGELDASGTFNVSNQALDGNVGIENLQLDNVRGLSATVFLSGN